MAVVKIKKTKRKKIKYFKFELKLSKSENEKIKLFCQVKKTTTNKLIKNALRDYMKRFGNLKLPEPIGKNQMNIFDVIGDSVEK
ncbi:MAG: hypothetical protein HXX18_06510 [Bacteroidetes bacterium]|nr:hypothetical protein [Bacteroidota bacterium]